MIESVFQIKLAAAMCASAVLEDVWLVTEADKLYILDKNKIRKEHMRKHRILVEDRMSHHELLKGLYCDGRKDSIISQEIRL